jgi:hypothetical protein
VSYTGEYLVGDDTSITDIAAKHKMTVDELVEMNHLVYRGQLLAVNKLDPYDNALPVVNTKVPSARFLQGRWRNWILPRLLPSRLLDRYIAYRLGLRP